MAPNSNTAGLITPEQLRASAGWNPPIPQKETNITRRIVTLFLCIWLATMSADDKAKDKSKGNGSREGPTGPRLR